MPFFSLACQAQRPSVPGPWTVASRVVLWPHTDPAASIAEMENYPSGFSIPVETLVGQLSRCHRNLVDAFGSPPVLVSGAPGAAHSRTEPLGGGPVLPGTHLAARGHTLAGLRGGQGMTEEQTELQRF